MSIEEAAKSGDKLQALYELRDKLAIMIDYCDNGHDVSALSNQFTRVLDQIADMEKAQAKGKRRKSSIEKARELMNG